MGDSVVGIIRPKAAFTPKADLLFTVGTTTARKSLEKNGIAKALRGHYKNELDVSGVFRQLSYYVSHHSAIENGGSRDSNANLKHQDTAETFDSLRPGHSHHQGFAERLVEEGFFPSVTAFNPTGVVLVSNDSTIGMPRKIYEAILDKLSPHVPEYLLQADDHKFQGKEYVSVQEIGPLTGAIGTLNFWDIVRQGVIDLNLKEPVILTEQITCLASRLSDPKSAPAFKVEAEVPIKFFMPDGLHRPLHCADRLVSSYAFEAALNHPDTPMGARYRDHLLDPTTAQRKVVDGLMRYGAQGLERKVISLHQQTVADVTQTPLQQKPLIIVQPAAGDMTIAAREVDRIAGNKIIKTAIRTNDDPAIRRFVAGNGGEFDAGMEIDGKTHYQHADAIVFPPLPAKGPLRMQSITQFMSAVVAKQLDPRYMDVPIIVLNVGGTWNSVMRCIDMNANYGFNKNIVMEPILRGGKAWVTSEHAKHFPTLFYDEVKSDNIRDAMHLAKRIVCQHRENYVRLELPHQFEPILWQQGTPAPDGMPIIVPIGSASSENLPLNRAAEDYMCFVAEQGCGMNWGGGDQKTMGAFMNGYRRGHGLWHMATSTHTITKSECITGSLPPGCDAYQLSRSIVPRMLTLFAGITELHPSLAKQSLCPGGDIITSFDGGPGTDQEGGFFMSLQNILPERMAGRSIMFFIPPHSTRGTFLEAVFGERTYAKWQKDHDLFADQGRFLATSEVELRTMTQDILAHRSLHRQRGASGLLHAAS